MMATLPSSLFACGACFMVRLEASSPGALTFFIQGLPLAALALLIARERQGVPKGKLFSELALFLVAFIFCLGFIAPLFFILTLFVFGGLLGVLYRGPKSARLISVAGFAAVLLLVGKEVYEAKQDPLSALDRLPVSEHMVSVVVAGGTLPGSLQPEDVVRALDSSSEETSHKAFLVLQALARTGRAEEKTRILSALQAAAPGQERGQKAKEELLPLYLR